MWKREMRDPNGHTNWESGIDAPPASGNSASTASGPSEMREFSAVRRGDAGLGL